jgi:sugar fermentation stimulation protein A
MRFVEPLVVGRLIRRYQRVLADFQLQDGTVVTAHCANPGSMRTCLEPGSRGWLSRSDDPRRKLRYTWQIAEVGRSRVYVYPAGANLLVKEGIEAGVVRELAGYPSLRSEVSYGARSRVDLLLEGDSGRCYVEVKNATLRLAASLAGFPDAVTERGLRHLDELEAMVAQGHRAVLLFCVSRTDARALAPADEIDPAYGHALRRAARRGVELLAYRALVSPREVRLKERVPVDLG